MTLSVNSRLNGTEKASVDIEMSTKQWAQTVRHGQRITFRIFDSEDLTGYLAGVDDKYFLVLEPHHDGFNRKLVRRSANPIMTFHAEHTFAREAFHEDMNKVVSSFRSWVLNNIFGSNPRTAKGIPNDQL